MARIDSILALVDRQGANELRLGTDREPQMFADGAQKRLSIPKTEADTLRELLGDLLSPANEGELVQRGQLQIVHEAQGLGPFRVTMTRRSPPGAALAIDVVFVRGRGKAMPAPPPPPMVTQPAARPPELPARTPAPPIHAPAPPPIAEPFDVASSLGAAPEVTPELVLLLQRASAMRASDLHLLHGEPPLLRVDGRLRALPNEAPIDLERLLGPRLMNDARPRLAEGVSADLGVGVPGLGRFRLNVFRTSQALAAAIRVLRATPPTLAELASPVPLDDLVDLPHGLVIVCGPTGSGKSSTLAALAHEALRRRPCLLISLEEPIEYTLGARGIQGAARQRQIGRDVRDFATGLRDALREDPDLLLIGEMRDPETIGLALTAAETGHLVLASLHSRSAASAVERIVDAYPPERHQQIRVQLADSLRAVVAQRLVPRAGGERRALAVEVLRVNHAIANAIRDSKISNIQSALQAGKKDGMLPLERCLADLVQKRVITLDDARAVANDATTLASYLTG